MSVSSTAWNAHLETLFSCRACPDVAGLPVTGAVRGARTMLVGQAPGPREEDAGKPFAYTAGTRLFEWFASIGASEETVRSHVYIGAAARCFPGRTPDGRSDRVPSPAEIARCTAHRERELELLPTGLVIAVGRLAAEIFLAFKSLRAVVGPVHRVNHLGRALDVVVLPHPSGRSTWLNKPENRELLTEALENIRAHPDWLGRNGKQEPG